MVRHLQPSEVDVRKKSRRAGFTLVEMVMVVVIIAVLAALTVPAMTRATENQKLYSAARALLGDLVSARQLAATGKKDTDPAPPNWGQTEVTASAGIVIQANGYQVFIDRNMQIDGDEIIQRVVTYTGGDSNIVITSPAPGTVIRFRRNGTLEGSPPADQTIIMRDTDSNRSEQLTVFYGGSVRID